MSSLANPTSHCCQGLLSDSKRGCHLPRLLFHHVGPDRLIQTAQLLLHGVVFTLDVVGAEDTVIAQAGARQLVSLLRITTPLPDPSPNSLVQVLHSGVLFSTCCTAHSMHSLPSLLSAQGQGATSRAVVSTLTHLTTPSSPPHTTTGECLEKSRQDNATPALCVTTGFTVDSSKSHSCTRGTGRQARGAGTEAQCVRRQALGVKRLAQHAV